MHSRFRALGPLAALVAALAFAGAAAAQPKLLFVGDSITVGSGATSPARDGFVARLDRRFPELRVVNAGCNGSTTRDWTIDGPSPFCVFGNAWDLLAAPELPAPILHVMLGTNDALGFFEAGPTPPEEYAARLRVLARRATGLVLVSSPPPIPGSPEAIASRLRAYRDAVAALVEEHAFVEWGVDSGALLDPTLDFSALDVIHPNDRGHRRIADALERRILALLPRGYLVRCRKAPTCGRLSFVPRYRHPAGPAGR